MAGVRLTLAALLALLLTGCDYNSLQSQDEQISAAWSEVLNQYQRRADLVPELVNTVQGYAAQEERVLAEVTNARAKVGGIQATFAFVFFAPLLALAQVAVPPLSGRMVDLTAALTAELVVDLDGTLRTFDEQRGSQIAVLR